MSIHSISEAVEPYSEDAVEPCSEDAVEPYSEDAVFFQNGRDSLLADSIGPRLHTLLEILLAPEFR